MSKYKKLGYRKGRPKSNGHWKVEESGYTAVRYNGLILEYNIGIFKYYVATESDCPHTGFTLINREEFKRELELRKSKVWRALYGGEE